MAYASTVTVTRHGDRVKVTVAETDAGTTAEATIESGIRYLKLISVEQDLTAGSAATVAPSVSTKTGGTAGDGLLYSASASAGALNAGLDVSIYSADGKLYHKANPNTGSNNSVTTVYHFKTDW
tara:strand:+ start:9383 stop:9754 length:372 start_codon:yes stop_codon:yes gene_type:complete